jgi:hypothetical protein
VALDFILAAFSRVMICAALIAFSSVVVMFFLLYTLNCVVYVNPSTVQLTLTTVDVTMLCAHVGDFEYAMNRAYVTPPFFSAIYCPSFDSVYSRSA